MEAGTCFELLMRISQKPPKYNSFVPLADSLNDKILILHHRQVHGLDPMTYSNSEFLKE
jgi:hypothetical protein